LLPLVQVHWVFVQALLVVAFALAQASLVGRAALATETLLQ